MAGGHLRIGRAGRVMTVGLSNPPHNFMNRAMAGELEELLTGLEADDSVGAVILTGDHPEAFITHYDVEEILRGSEQVGRQVPARLAGGALRATGALSRLPKGAGALARTQAAGLVELRRIHDVFRRMNRSDKVFIAAINGIASGGGCELALACDLRIVSDAGGPIGQPEILLGLIPGGGGSQRLTRLLGSGRALELILEGRVVDPEEAAAIGLVHRVVPAAELLAEATATAERLARRPPGSVAAAKRTVYEGGAMELDRGLHMERAEFLSVTAAAPGVRAMRAYVDELQRLGGPPIADEEEIGRWLDGTAVDLVSDA
jgi:enoyl-CoA hydratase